MSNPEESDVYRPQTPEEAQAAFEHLYDELLDLLHTSVENATNLKDNPHFEPPPGLSEKLARLEREVALFNEIGKSVNAAPEKRDLQQDPLTRREKASIERGKKLIKKAEEVQSQMPLHPPTGAKEIGDTVDRRKHFKRLGRKKI